MASKCCGTCGIELTPQTAVVGRRMCKPCNRAYMRNWRANNKDRQLDRDYRRNYGLSLRDYELMFIQQGGTCAICGKHADEQVRRLAVDHDHATGVIRALLCDACNIALGGFRDDPELLLAAASYLREHGK